MNPAGFVSLALSIISGEEAVGPGAQGPRRRPPLFMNLINNATPWEEGEIYKSTQKKSSGGGRRIESRLLAGSAGFRRTLRSRSV